MHTVLFLCVRVLHILIGAVWIGSTVFSALMVTPAIEASGTSGGHVMMRINKRGLVAYFAVLGATTIVTGLYLFWHFTGFTSDLMVEHAGIAFATGGVSGMLAALVGGAVVGRSAHEIGAVMAQASRLADGPDKGTLMIRATTLRTRIQYGTRAVIGLQFIALVLMAVGHYV